MIIFLFRLLNYDTSFRRKYTHEQKVVGKIKGKTTIRFDTFVEPDQKILKVGIHSFPA